MKRSERMIEDELASIIVVLLQVSRQRHPTFETFRYPMGGHGDVHRLVGILSLMPLGLSYGKYSPWLSVRAAVSLNHCRSRSSGRRVEKAPELPPVIYLSGFLERAKWLV